MRSKTPLALMEQVVMVLVFALAAALCLQVFAVSNQVSRRNEAMDRAVLEAQNAAEAIKAAGNIHILQEAMGAQTMDGKLVTVCYDEYWNSSSAGTAYRLTVRETPSHIPGLCSAEITVDRGNGEAPLFSITVAWQEVGGNG